MPDIELKQIHELVSYSGTLAAGTYFAADNGTDTTKLDYNTLATAIINKLGLSVQSTNFTISVGGDGYETATVDVSRTGYTAIALVGWQINSTTALVPIYINRQSATSYLVRLRNVTSNPANNISCSIAVLYMKT